MKQPMTSLLIPHPRAQLLTGPTAIDRAPNLGGKLGIELLIKRDDCTGLAFGGNKVRQLEFYFGKAQQHGADTILITGAIQSNFVRVAAAAAARLGMEMHIQLEERVPDVDETYRNSGNVLLDKLLGATLHMFPVGKDETAADAALYERARQLELSGKIPFVIPLGAGHEPTGALGYVVAAEEIITQLAQDALDLDFVVLASGSGLTHIGLLTGLRLLNNDVPVAGICVRRAADAQRLRLSSRIADLGGMLDCRGLVSDDDVWVTDNVLAPGYGQLSGPVFRALKLTATLEGLILDPVYTGKAMAGLIELVESGRIPAGSRVLFIHTGGTPGLFGYGEKLAPYLTAMDNEDVEPVV